MSCSATPAGARSARRSMPEAGTSPIETGALPSGSIQSSRARPAGTSTVVTALTVRYRLPRSAVATSAGLASGPARTTTTLSNGRSAVGASSSAPSANASANPASASPRQSERLAHHGAGCAACRIGVAGKPQPFANPLPDVQRRRDAGHPLGERREPPLPAADRRRNRGVGLRDAVEPAAGPPGERARAHRTRRAHPGVRTGRDGRDSSQRVTGRTRRPRGTASAVRGRGAPRI